MKSNKTIAQTEFEKSLASLGGRLTPQTIMLQDYYLSDQYFISRVVATGKHSTIYRGVDLKLKEERAFKLYNLKELQLLNEGHHLQQLRGAWKYQYLNIMGKSQSINLLKCFDIFEDNNYLVVVLQLCKGGTLRQEITQRLNHKVIQEILGATIVKQVVYGLIELHRFKVINFRLTSQHIFIKNGIYKVGSSGVSTLLEEKEEEGDKDFLMSPQMKNGEYSLQTQVWTVGLLMYEVLFGELPKKQQFTSVIGFVMSRKAANSLSEKMLNFLRGCLNINLKDRFQWNDMMNELNEMSSYVPQSTLIQNQMEENKIISRKRCDSFISDAFVVDVGMGRELEGKWLESIHLVDGMHYLKDEKQKLMDYIKDYKSECRPFDIIKEKDAGNIKSNLENINVSEDRVYQEMSCHYLECRKSQFLYRRLVWPLMNRKIIPPKERESIEFHYLLISRCFFNMSKVNYQVKHSNKSYANILQNCVTDYTAKLYHEVQKQFQKCAQELTSTESQTLNMIGDKFKRLFSGKEEKRKDTFLAGLEGVDFDRNEQVGFTQTFYENHIKKSLKQSIKKMEEGEQNWNISKAIVAMMENYQAICLWKGGKKEEKYLDMNEVAQMNKWLGK